MRVNDKGQVTIPKELRDALGLSPGTKVEFDQQGATIVIRRSMPSLSRGEKLAKNLRGHGDVEITTDEIMGLSRGA